MIKTQKICNFKKAFESFILEKLNETINNIWDIDRLKELKSILNFENRPPNPYTEYLELKIFKERKVLHKPSERINN